MQFKLITNEDGTKEIHHRNEAGTPFTLLPLGIVDTPSDPLELFAWLTEKMKDAGAVPANTNFTLNTT